MIHPKDIKIEATTMCSPDYTRYNRKVKGKKKHHISVENNRIHTYKLVDGERVECDEGRCKVIKEEFYNNLRVPTWRYDYSNGYYSKLLPQKLKTFIHEALHVRAERNRSQHTERDHLALCESERLSYDKRYERTQGHESIRIGQSKALRSTWVLSRKLNKFSNPISEFDSLKREWLSSYYPTQYIRIANWLECDAWPVHTTTTWKDGHSTKIQQAMPLVDTHNRDIWFGEDTLEESDYIYFMSSDFRAPFFTSRSRTLGKLYRDGTIEYLPNVGGV